MHPTRDEADKILAWANECNPGPWINHCKVAARAAETIAEKCGLDTERAYVSGLLHDIGYYSYVNGKGEKDHIFAGYEFMKKRGYDDIAKICLSHSFPCQDVRELASSWLTCNDAETAFITKFLTKTKYDDYDRLIQLCDAICLPQGIVIMEKRLMEVVMRKGFRDFTLNKWRAWLSLKDYFDKLCGINIYSLFYYEISANIFD